MKKALFCTLLTLSLCLMVLPALAYCPDHPQHTDECGFDKVNEASCSHVQSLCAQCQYNCMNPGHEYGDWEHNGNGTHSSTCIKCLDVNGPRGCSSGNCTTAGDCAYCGSPNAQPHYWYSYNSDYNGKTHTRICSLDNSHTQTEDCHGGTATCIKGPACVVCDQIYGAPNFNNHNYSGSHTYENNDYHHKVCLNNGCGEPLRQEHSGGYATCMEKAICNICKKHYGDYGEHEWVEFHPSATPGIHVVICSQHSSHTKEEACSGGTATCTDAAICTSCNHRYGDALDHAYGDWHSNGDGTHSRTCRNGCGQTEEAPCSGGTATCDAPGLCTVCNSEWGKKRIHWYGPWQYTDVETAPHHMASCRYADCTHKKTVPCQLIAVELEGDSTLQFCPVCGYSPDALFTPVSATATGEISVDLMVYITEKPTADALYGISIFWEKSGEPFLDHSYYPTTRRIASFPLSLGQVYFEAPGPVGGVSSCTYENGILTVDVTGHGCAFILLKNSQTH